ncbi:hypothetical protein GJQ54_07840 [Oceanospirillaceae bacterium ASx5O]|nr:hypothetical protein GJQ54_07840 [Oceanospirillaceae bacterium ASx5O]
MTAPEHKSDPVPPTADNPQASSADHTENTPTSGRDGRRFVIIPQQGPRIRVRYREGSSGTGDCTLCQISPDNL